MSASRDRTDIPPEKMNEKHELNEQRERICINVARDSYLPRHTSRGQGGEVTQVVERWSPDQEVRGSNPNIGRFICPMYVPLCDQASNQCVNGFCELQAANQQLGCTCFNGFIKDPASPLVCHPIPPCNLMPGAPDQQCLNGWCQMLYNGNFGCQCKQGFQLSVTNPNICENIDECTQGTSNCPSSACIDMPGDYMCSACYPGYTLSAAGKCQSSYGANGAQQTWQEPNPWLWAWMWDSMLF
ncbi:hypothetical protein EGW08_014050 [Elysia chlorotica]|uniref:EGF-like domain-containing protein n=1 Tax=Elysia chlorotica TaxID=188477 RepID=A0A433T9C9_ELYCH|nr:hypothetical protein EGW08_014050 [Elysia chlorotica]